MNIYGVWKVKEMQPLFGDNHERKNIEEALTAESDYIQVRNYQEMLTYRWIITEDNKMLEGRVLPDEVTEEQIAQASEQGANIIDRIYVRSEKALTEEDGEMYFQADVSDMPEEQKKEVGHLKTEGDMLVLNAVFALYYLEKVK